MATTELLNQGFRYALSFTGNRHDAEDLVHDAWLNVYKKYGPLTNKYLLCTAVRNLFIDNYRKAKPFNFETLEDHPELAHPEGPDQLEVNATREEVQSALAVLRPEEREAIYLNYFEGLTAAQIAERNHMPRSSVLSLMARGKQKMAKALRALAVVQERKVVIPKKEV
jgi:RNA polymerase sigma-70 factor (ECF subfamily)